MDGAFVRRIGAIADRPKAVEGAGERELRGSQAVDEVATPDPAGLLHRAQHRVDRAETAVDSLRGDRLAREHAMSLEHRETQGVQALGRGRRRRAVHERPATGGLGRTECGEAARPVGAPRAVGAPGSLPAQGTQRGERVVGDLAGPDQVPQRIEDVTIPATARRRVDLAIEGRPALGQVVADGVVPRAVGRSVPSGSPVGRRTSRPGRTSAIRPSSRPRLPRPTQATSPRAPSSSSNRGE